MEVQFVIAIFFTSKSQIKRSNVAISVGQRNNPFILFPFLLFELWICRIEIWKDSTYENIVGELSWCKYAIAWEWSSCNITINVLLNYKLGDKVSHLLIYKEKK